MTDRERIERAIAQVTDDELPALADVVEAFIASKGKAKGFLAKLKRIQIEGPEDFAAQADRYAVEGFDGK